MPTSPEIARKKKAGFGKKLGNLVIKSVKMFVRQAIKELKVIVPETKKLLKKLLREYEKLKRAYKKTQIH